MPLRETDAGKHYTQGDWTAAVSHYFLLGLAAGGEGNWSQFLTLKPLLSQKLLWTQRAFVCLLIFIVLEIKTNITNIY